MNILSYFIPAPISSAYRAFNNWTTHKATPTRDKQILSTTVLALAALGLHKVIEKKSYVYGNTLLGHAVNLAFTQVPSYQYAYTTVKNGLTSDWKSALVTTAVVCFLTSRPVADYVRDFNLFKF